MKYIKKNPEPAAFAQWKQQSNADWKPNWDNFQKPEKPIVHDALLSEQGYICCYCGQRINQITSHIEHFQPRTFYPNLKLEYKTSWRLVLGTQKRMNPNLLRLSLRRSSADNIKGLGMMKN